MDDYVSKPVDRLRLIEAVEGGTIACDAGAEPGGRAARAFDREAVLRRLDGDQALLGEMIALYLEDVDGLLGEIHAAYASGDRDRLGRAAHAFKGASANFGATRVVEAAKALEEMARQGAADADLSAACRRLDADAVVLVMELYEAPGSST